MYKATFSFDKTREVFTIPNSMEHTTQVLMPGINIDQVQVTSPRPFNVEIRSMSAPSIPHMVKSKPISAPQE